jgi:succinate dehydrogenase/fumarate reductase flavoprotein subunit
MEWPWKNEGGEQTVVETDVLVLGGGLSGCFAAIAAARRGLNVALVEK